MVEFRRDGLNVLLLQRTNRAGFKAGALKAGLERSYQPYIALFGVDYIPPADFLRRCLPPLIADPDLAFVQARCDFLNAGENRVTRAQQVMPESHFAVEQPAHSWAGRIVPFNGTCGIWRRSAIETAGGWQTNTLTEDLDLSYRAQLAGWRSLYLVNCGFWRLLGITIFTIGMHSYAGATTTRGVLQALLGRDSAFVRTPKRGALVGPDSAASRGRPLEDRPRSGAPRRQPLSRMVRRFSKRAFG